MDERSSYEIDWMLMRDSMRPVAVGAAKASNRVASAPVRGEEDRKRRHSPSGGEEFRPNMKPGRVRIVRARPFLAVIDCGRG
jgi:hypothetical protein